VTARAASRTTASFECRPAIVYAVGGSRILEYVGCWWSWGKGEERSLVTIANGGGIEMRP
jgi:hypothetical protein